MQICTLPMHSENLDTKRGHFFFFLFFFVFCVCGGERKARVAAVSGYRHENAWGCWIKQLDHVEIKGPCTVRRPRRRKLYPQAPAFPFFRLCLFLSMSILTFRFFLHEKNGLPLREVRGMAKAG